MRIAALLFCLVYAALGEDVDQLIEAQTPALVAIYKDLHAHPELSHFEERTSGVLAAGLREAGFTVTERIGKYANGQQAYGVVGLMQNGPGPVLMVRADMDALPVEEKTGLPYASRVRIKDEAGQEVGAMHACGHDVHVACLIGTARILARLKDRWHGTLMLLGQPSEEQLDGAKAMLNDGLYSRFPKPDFGLALHDAAELETGKVGITEGPMAANSTAVDVVLRGLGGHGARPSSTKDPIVLAAQFILALQTIVSRQNDPLEPAVVTVGSIHGGTRHNIIPDEVVLQITVRAFSESVRQDILASIERMAKGLAMAAGVPEERAPIVRIVRGVPVTYNDPELARRMEGVFAARLGKENVLLREKGMGSEDFGLYGGEDHRIPTLMFRVGAVDPRVMAESKRTGKKLPSAHSSLFAPVPDETIRTGLRAMTAGILEILR